MTKPAVHYRCQGFTVADLQGLTHALCKAFPLEGELSYSNFWPHVTCTMCKKLKGREVNYLLPQRRPEEILDECSCEVLVHALTDRE